MGGHDEEHDHHKRFSVLYQEDPNNPVQIELDRPSLQFQPGEIIQGRVLLVLESQIEIKEIKIQFLGTGRTSWAIIQDKRKISDQNHASSEVYLDNKSRIFGDGSTPKTILPGITEYPFKFTLPDNLPNTFIDAYGSVTYVVKAFVKLRTEEKIGMAAFLINSVYDLNTEPELHHHAELYAKKRPGCCCPKGGLVEMTVSFAKRGYIPGEMILWHAVLVNNSSRRVKNVTAKFVQRVNFMAEGFEKDDTKVLSTLVGGAVKRKKTEKWDGQFIVPMTIPTRLGINGFVNAPPKLINLQYFVVFKMTIGCARNLTAEIPITIGTIPLKHRSLSRSDEVSTIVKFGHDRQSSGNVAT